MSTTFEYTELDKQNPVGSNRLSARAKFYQRSLYKEVIYPSNIVTPLDGWYDKNLFGRVDQQQYPILAKASRLVPIEGAASLSVQALDFVNLAFTRFRQHMLNAYLTNCINRGGNPALYDLKVVLAYTDPVQKYMSHTRGLANAFISTMRSDASDPIKNFEQFKKQYLQYLLNMAEGVPVTLSTFLLSVMTSPMVSGMKIALATENAGDDSVKYDDFISDPNFDFYIQAAKKYGFLVDKNAPWILTADLFSTAMLSYLEYFPLNELDISPVTKETFFDTYFDRAYPVAITTLSYVVGDAYSRYYEFNPLYEEEKTHYRPHCPESPLQVKVGRVAPPSAADVLTPQETINTYSALRKREVQNAGPALKEVRRRAYELYRGDHALYLGVGKFINDSYQDFIYPSGYSRVNRTFNVDTARRADIIDTAGEVASAISTTY